MSRRVSGLLFLAVLLAGVARIAASYPVFSATVDENEHIEAGLEYWQLGRYLYEPQHPPLARAVLGAGPYFFDELRLGEERTLFGNRLRKPVSAPRKRFESFLWAGEWSDPGRRRETLTTARAGNLAFWILLAIVVYGWTLEALGARAALAATAIAACSPTLLAHAGLATLDLAAAATATAAMFAFWRWSRGGGLRDLCLAGAALGIAFASKLSLLAFLPPALLLLVWATRADHLRGKERRKEAVKSAAIYLGVAALVLLAVYRFDFGTIGPGGAPYLSPELMAADTFAASLGALAGGWYVPAPALLRGVIDVVAHNEAGHYTYLFGEWSREGSLLYFPVAMAVKLTLPFLALAAWGAVQLYGEDRRLLIVLLALPATTLAASIPADINIGIRHVLPMLPCLAIVAAAPFRTAGAGAAKWLPIALLVWHGGESLRAQPDHLSYFNQIAMVREKPILLDSNYDWGQDYRRLAEWIEAEGLEAVIVNGFGDIPPEMPDRVLPPGHEDAGWFAVSSNIRYGIDGFSPEFRALMETDPVAVVGRTIQLYRIDPRELPKLVPPRVLKRYVESPEAR